MMMMIYTRCEIVGRITTPPTMSGVQKRARQGKEEVDVVLVRVTSSHSTTANPGTNRLRDQGHCRPTLSKEMRIVPETVIQPEKIAAGNYLPLLAIRKPG
jgi:hypothetical protein